MAITFNLSAAASAWEQWVRNHSGPGSTGSSAGQPATGSTSTDTAPVALVSPTAPAVPQTSAPTPPASSAPGISYVPAPAEPAPTVTYAPDTATLAVGPRQQVATGPRLRDLFDQAMAASAATTSAATISSSATVAQASAAEQNDPRTRAEVMAQAAYSLVAQASTAQGNVLTLIGKA